MPEATPFLPFDHWDDLVGDAVGRWGVAEQGPATPGAILDYIRRRAAAESEQLEQALASDLTVTYDFDATIVWLDGYDISRGVEVTVTAAEEVVRRPFDPNPFTPRSDEAPGMTLDELLGDIDDLIEEPGDG